MAVYQTPRTRLNSLVLVVAALLVGFAIISFHLTRESLWEDEGFTIGVIHDSAPPPESIREALQFVRESLSNTFARVRTDDIHPPLYYLTLDLWTLLVGESLFAVRLYSALWALLALAATYAVGRQVFASASVALMAVVILETASFFVYYSREARMYTLLMALVALSMVAYVRWSRRPNLRRALIYVLLMAAMLYTHYVSVFVMLAQIIHLMLFTRLNLKRVFVPYLPYLLTLTFFAPWLPSALTQLQPGPGALPLPSDWSTVAALLLILTNGFGWLYAALAFFAFWRSRMHRHSVALLTLWLLVLPTALLLLNAVVRPLFQVRYVTPILPAFALLIALGIHQFAARRFVPLRLVVPFGVAFLQLTTYSQFWPNKPAWDTSVRRMTEARQLLEPAITSLSPYSPAAYYDRLYHLRQGIALDLSWRWQESSAMNGYVEAMRDSPAVWVVMPSHFASTWDAVIALLGQGRGVGYRDSMMNMIFYRFDNANGTPLRFRFGDVLRWKGGIGHQLYARVGEPFCFSLRFDVLQPLDSRYTLDLALTQGYHTRRAGTALTFAAQAVGDEVRWSPCIDVPADNPSGPHHLRVRVLYNDRPLPLMEGENQYWSEELMPAQVSVE